jgi:hypothetical protein
MLMGSHVVETSEQRRKYRKAEEAILQAERREFHENNEAWGKEVREYEAVMKKQDE